jgi:hypothetical protein
MFSCIAHVFCQVEVLWVVTPYSVVVGYQPSSARTSETLVSYHNYTASQPRRPLLETSPSWKPQNSYILSGSVLKEVLLWETDKGFWSLGYSLGNYVMNFCKVGVCTMERLHGLYLWHGIAQWCSAELRAGWCRGRGGRIFSSPPRSDLLWGPPSLLTNGYQGSFPGGKAAGTWTWPLTSI